MNEGCGSEGELVLSSLLLPGLKLPEEGRSVAVSGFTSRGECGPADDDILRGQRQQLASDLLAPRDARNRVARRTDYDAAPDRPSYGKPTSRSIRSTASLTPIFVAVTLCLVVGGGGWLFAQRAKAGFANSGA